MLWDVQLLMDTIVNQLFFGFFFVSFFTKYISFSTFEIQTVATIVSNLRKSKWKPLPNLVRLQKANSMKFTTTKSCFFFSRKDDRKCNFKNNLALTCVFKSNLCYKILYKVIIMINYYYYNIFNTYMMYKYNFK